MCWGFLHRAAITRRVWHNHLNCNKIHILVLYVFGLGCAGIPDNMTKNWWKSQFCRRDSVLFWIVMPNSLEEIPASIFRVLWRWGWEVTPEHCYLSKKLKWWHTRPQLGVMKYPITLQNTVYFNLNIFYMLVQRLEHFHSVNWLAWN